MCADRRQYLNEGDTLVRRLAHSLSAPHLDCDAGWAERHELGIADEPPEGSDEQRCQWDIREGVWRDRLVDFDQWPLLFVCGSKHSERFRDLLTRAGIEAIVYVACWEPRKGIGS